MEPNSFGRRLGIGVRVASRMVKERARDSAARSASGSAPAAASGARDAATRRSAARSAAAKRDLPKLDLKEPARRVGQGTRRFGQAFLGPLAHTGVRLWLEITGLFFALFGLFFLQNAYRLRAAVRGGPEHEQFVLYAVLTAIFFYFSCTSFLRSMRRSKQGRAR